MSRQTQFDHVNLLGIEVDAVTLSEAATYICTFAGDKARPAGYIIKPYVEFLDRAASNPGLKELLNRSELAVADGVALLWAGNYLYAGPHTFWRFWLTLGKILLKPADLAWPLPERAAGTNFTWQLLRIAAAQNLKIYLIGKPSDAEIASAADTIRTAIPTIQIAGSHSGYDPGAKRGTVTDVWYESTLVKLRAVDPDLVLVGMGFPLQEQVSARLADDLPHGIMVGEGGTFDYESFGGGRRKAPARLQQLGLEWLWRLVLEPSRWRRQLAIPRFIYRIWRSR